jgi:N6-adenosine-specific RNA methylase IME4
MIADNLTAFSEQKFAVIVADPPWMYQKNVSAQYEGSRAIGVAEGVYPTMTTEDIAALPVADLADDDAHLFMWTTNPKMFGGRFSGMTAEQIVAAWGFEYRTILTWVKTTNAGVPLVGGMGHYFRGATEHVIYATRGKAKIPVDRREPNFIFAPRRGHSQKPPEFMAMVERVCDGPYLELFARRARPGWSAFGNEVEEEAVLFA